ncbi:response regulator transcription factor [Flindersiella endophytica]
MESPVVEQPRLLLVEDDGDLAEMLSVLLTEEGYALDLAADGQRALHLALSRAYDVIVLDRGLPAIDGLDVLTRIRSRAVTTPVLVLSALANPVDRVEGLDAGAEDYLGKPFDINELLARLRALRRRHLEDARYLPVGNRRLDPQTRQVRGSADRPVRLSERECALLTLLATYPNRVFSRADLLARAFPEAESEAVVDTYVHYLRRKLGRGVITTVHGRGYQLGAS